MERVLVANLLEAGVGGEGLMGRTFPETPLPLAEQPNDCEKESPMLPSAPVHMPSPDIFIIATYFGPIFIFISNDYPFIRRRMPVSQELTVFYIPVLASEFLEY